MLRSVSESNNNNNAKHANSKKTSPASVDEIYYKEIRLLDLINDCPQNCTVQWPLKGLNIRCWTEFCLANNITIKCDIAKLIQLLTPPLIIRPNEREFHEAATKYWDSFKHDPTAVYSVCIRNREDVIKEQMSEVPGDQIKYWHWQKKLLFILVCLFAANNFKKMVANSFEPRLNGIVCSILNVVRTDYRVAFYSLPSNTKRFKSQLLGNFINYFDLDFRVRSKMEKTPAPVLNRYVKQEKIYFMLLAMNWMLYFRSPYFNFNCHLGVLRYMMMIDDNLILKHDHAPDIHKEIQVIALAAKTIWKIIEFGDTQVWWLSDSNKQRDLIHCVNDLIQEIPIGTEYISLISDCFIKSTSHLPEIVPHRVHFMNRFEALDKLLASWEYSILGECELNSNNSIYFLVENQIARSVKDYYEALNTIVVDQHSWSIVTADVFDPATQKYAVFVVISNKSFYLMQAMSWAAYVYQNKGGNKKIDTSGFSMLMFSMRGNDESIKFMIIMFRLLLLGHPIEKVVRDINKIQDHAKDVRLFLDGYFYSEPVPENAKEPLHAMFQPANAQRTTLMKQLLLKGKNLVTKLIVIMMLYPFLDKVGIEGKINAKFLSNVMTFWRSGCSSEVKVKAKADNALLVKEAKFCFPVIAFSDTITSTSFQDLPMVNKKSAAELKESTEPIQGSLEDLHQLLEIMKKAPKPVGSLTLLAYLSCIIPVLPVSSAYFNELFAKPVSGNIVNIGTVSVDPKVVHWPNQTELKCADEKNYDCWVHDLFQHEANNHWDYSIFRSSFFDTRVPLLEPDFSSQIYLPKFTHNGELVNPVFTSFLHSMPERKHDVSDTALKNLLTAEKKKPAHVSTTKRPRASSPPPSPVYTPEAPPEIKLPETIISNNNNNNVEMYSPTSPGYNYGDETPPDTGGRSVHFPTGNRIGDSYQDFQNNMMLDSSN